MQTRERGGRRVEAESPGGRWSRSKPLDEASTARTVKGSSMADGPAEGSLNENREEGGEKLEKEGVEERESCMQLGSLQKTETNNRS